MQIRELSPSEDSSPEKKMAAETAHPSDEIVESRVIETSRDDPALCSLLLVRKEELGTIVVVGDGYYSDFVPLTSRPSSSGAEEEVPERDSYYAELVIPENHAPGSPSSPPMPSVSEGSSISSTSTSTFTLLPSSIIEVLPAMITTTENTTTAIKPEESLENKEYDPLSPPFDGNIDSSSDTVASLTGFHPSGGWVSSFDDELDEIVEEEIALIDFFAETRDKAVTATTTTTTTTVAPIVKTEQIEPDWNDIHQQGEELQMMPYQRRFEHRPLEIRVLLLDSDLENQLRGEERTIGREVAIKREPLSEEEEEMGIYWEDAYMMSVKDLKSRRSSSLPDNIRKQGKKIIIDGEEPSSFSSSLSEKISELESSEKEEEIMDEEVEEEEEKDDKEKDEDFRIEEVEEDEDDEDEEEKGKGRKKDDGKKKKEKENSEEENEIEEENEEEEQEREEKDEEGEEEEGNEEEENRKEEEEEERKDEEEKEEDGKEEGSDDDSGKEEEEEEKEKEEEKKKKEEEEEDSSEEEEEKKKSDDKKSSQDEDKTSRSASLEVSSKSSDESEYSVSSERLGKMRDGEEDDSEESDEDWELLSSRAACLAAKPKRALGVQTRRSAAKEASAATKTTKITDSMERPASELMDSRSESLDVVMEETGVP